MRCGVTLGLLAVLGLCSPAIAAENCSEKIVSLEIACDSHGVSIQKAAGDKVVKIRSSNIEFAITSFRGEYTVVKDMTTEQCQEPALEFVLEPIRGSAHSLLVLSVNLEDGLTTVSKPSIAPLNLVEIGCRVEVK